MMKRNKKFTGIAREDRDNSLENSHLELQFDAKQKTGEALFAAGDGVRSVNLGPIASNSKYKVTSSYRKEMVSLEKAAHTACLIWKKNQSSKVSINWSIGFQTRNWELTDNKRTKGKYQVIISSNVVFALAEHQKDGATDAGRVADIRAIERIVHFCKIIWYVPLFTPNFDQQNLKLERILSRSAIKLSFIRKFVQKKKI